MSESLDSKKFPTYCVALTQKQTHMKLVIRIFLSVVTNPLRFTIKLVNRWGTSLNGSRS
jgi:hypothetical protein